MPAAAWEKRWCWEGAGAAGLVVWLELSTLLSEKRCQCLFPSSSLFFFFFLFKGLLTT